MPEQEPTGTGKGAPDALVEAQRAMGTVVRSFVLASIGRHASEGFDVCDTTHCAVYRGLDGGQALDDLRRNLAPTAGIILSHEGWPVRAFFHSTCGGKTHTPEQVWGNTAAYPYKPVTCPYCKGAKHYRWSNRIEKADIARALSIPPDVVGAHSCAPLRLVTVGKNGIRIEWPGSSMLITREEFRIKVCRALGWTALYSPWFDMRLTGNAYEFDGRGFGHGVGLCEEGAKEMARRGFRWQAIVKRYFPRANIEQGGGPP